MSTNNHKLMQHNSFDTLSMSGRRLSRSNDAVFHCSQQSILSAMDRFVKAVNNMDATVMVPSRLRDMDLNGRRTSITQPPPVLLQQSDLHAFYMMLHEVKKELLWGPSSVANTIASSTLNGSHSSLTSSATQTPCASVTGTPIHQTSQPNKLKRPNAGSSVSLVSMDSVREGVLLTAVNASTLARSKLKKEPSHSRQPSDDSLGSFGSGTSTLDLDSESEVDSVLAEKSSGEQRSDDEHSTHLAIAFKQHLQGLHAILHQLADTADYFCARYQEELDAMSEN